MHHAAEHVFQFSDQPHDPAAPKARRKPFSFSFRTSKADREIETPRLEATPEDLPGRYPGNAFWAVARDPHCLFAYWQLAIPVTRLPAHRLVLAVTRDGQLEASYNIRSESGWRFIPVSRPGATYRLTLAFVPLGQLTPAAHPAPDPRHHRLSTPGPANPPSPTAAPAPAATAPAGPVPIDHLTRAEPVILSPQHPLPEPQPDLGGDTPLGYGSLLHGAPSLAREFAFFKPA